MPDKPRTLDATKVPQLPAVPSDASPSIKVWMAAMKEALEIRLGRVGDQRDRAVTLRELIDSGLAKDLTNRPYDPNQDSDFTWFVDPPDLTVPPKPTNFTATGVFTRIILTWTEGWTVFSNFSYTEIYRHTSNALGDATIIDITQAGVYTDNVDYADTYYYWVRHVSTSEVKGPFSDSATATTAIDIGAVMGTLSEDLTDLPGYTTLINTTVPNLITTTTNARTRIIKSDSEPSTREDSSALQPQDIWIDTNDNNQMYIRNSANDGWVEARDGTLVTLVNTHASTISSHTSSIASNVTDIATVTSANSALTTTVNNLSATVNTKARTFFADDPPTSTAIGDLWVDTNDSNKLYRAASVGADQVASGEWVLARDTVNDNYPRVFTQTSAPTAINTGDIWFDTDDSNTQYRWDGSNWVLIRDVTTQAAVGTEATARASGDTANANSITSLTTTVNAKNQTFVQASAPTAVAIGDLWIDSDDSNKLYRASATGTGNWVAVNDTSNTGITVYAQNAEPSGGTYIEGDLWFDTNDNNKQYRHNGSSWVAIPDGRIASNATAVSNLSTAVGLSGASSTKIEALEASIGNVYGARVITTNTSNNVKVETMVNSAGSTTTATHGISASDVTAGVFLSLKNAVATGGLTAQQLNKTFKVASRINTTQLQVETVGDAATSAATSTTVVDGATIGANAGLAQLATVTADIEGNAHSSYVLQVSANGSVAGMVIEANAEAGGTASAVQFVSDKFAIWNNSNAGVAPFIVANNTVYMANAMIQNAAIDTAQIANLAVEEGKIDNLAVTNLKVASSAITEEKVYDLTVTGAKIRHATITNLHVREGTFEKAKINSLYAHSISGDVSKATSGSLANSIDFNNRLANNAAFGWFDVLTLSLPKPTHPDGWAPYANFNVNRVETDKNSWYHLQIEMAVWNVNSVGTTAVEQGNDLVGDNDGICASQSPSGAGNLTINGALASSGSVTLTTPRKITITKDNTADIGRSFTITGTDSSNNAQTETITTMESTSTSAEGTKSFKTITQVAVDAAMTGNIVVGISNLISVYGNGYSAGTVYHDYLQFTPTYSNSNATLTISSSVFIQDVNSESGGISALTPDLIAGNSAYLSDGTTRKQIESFLPITSGGNITGYTFSYEDADTAPVSGWSGNQALYFSKAITAGNTGPYVRKSLIDWIAVDTAYNDFSIAGVWSDADGTRNVNHGVKARLQYRSNHDGSWEQDVATMTLHEATGFLMGVR